MTKIQVKAGSIFGDLTLVKELEGIIVKRKNRSPERVRTFLCKCKCGRTCEVRLYCLTSGRTKTCGCSRFKSKNQTHGMSKTRTYKSWVKMLERCKNKKSNKYHIYGDRGISVCERWNKFENFYKDMGKRPDNMSIDRIDPDSGYCKENCRWATPKQQARNTRKNLNIEYNGVTRCLSEWSEVLEINVKTLMARYIAGDRDDRLFRPVQSCKK